ncbi:MAG: CHASE2 domain-containing protein [Burkholderiaceae bacterium]
MSTLQRSRLWRALAGLLIVLAFAAAELVGSSSGLFGAVDRQMYDGRQRLLVPQLDERIVIVDIDERSLGEQGRWPWPRAKVAELTTRLAERGKAAVIGYDVVFAEPQAGSDDDQRLAAALEGRPVVLGYYLSSDRDGRTSGALPEPVFSGDTARELAPLVTHASGFGANLPELQQAARGSGFFNPFLGGGLDPDGVIRALPLLATFGDGVYESLAVAVLRQYLGDATVTARPDRLVLDGRRGAVDIPVSVGFTAMAPVAGRGGPAGGHFRYLSATDVLNDRVDWSLLHDRIVLVGTTAPGQTDLRATPVSEVFPGVEIHASLIAGALDGRLKQRLAEAPLLGAAVTAAVGGLLAAVLPALGVIGAVLACAVALLMLIGGNAIAYGNAGLVLPLSGALAAVLAVGVFNVIVGWFAEGRARRAVVQLFGEYVSPALVEQMARDPASWQSLESSNRELSILFADIRGFTRIAETMEPGALREYLNTFLTGMTEIIHAHRGTVDKYMGDAVMAFWGAPLEDPSHADHAVAAAMAMQAAAQRMSERFVARGQPPLAIGIGINTGIVRVGDMGSTLRRAYTVIGDAVNLASRLEGLTKHYEVPIIVGETTAGQCRQHLFLELDRVAVAGRVESVRVFVPKVMARNANAESIGPSKKANQAAPTNAREALHEGSSPGM